MRILRSLWIWTAFAMLVLAWVPLVGCVRLFDRDRRRLRTARWYRRLGRALARINPWRLHISGGEHIRPHQHYVVVSNHQSLGDIPLLSHLPIDTKWVGKAEVFRLPAIGWMARWAGDIPVERADHHKGARAFRHAARVLREGCSVVFFPEGTRSRDGQVQAFSEGPFQLAIREQVPVLPLVVDGSGSALPRNTWLFGGIQDIYLRVLEPVPVRGWTTRQSGALRDAVRQTIVDELERLRRG